MDVTAAEGLPDRFLRTALPRRWAHSRGVGRAAAALAPWAGEHAETLTVAALLHDVGYAPQLAATGFHPLDGARYLRDRTRAGPLVVTLVAHHSGAMVEAAERGLAGPLAAEFPLGPDPVPRLLAAVTYCDLSTTPDGTATTPEERLEVLARYPPDSAVHRVVARHGPVLLRETAAALGPQARQAAARAGPGAP